MFAITPEHLERLAAVNHFAVPQDEMVFVGLRGCLPVDPDDHRFAREHVVRVVDLDYTHPRCTIVQWRPQSREVALFAASTVPHRRYVKRAVERNGVGVNQLMTGYYDDYRKGVHKAGDQTGHEAFRQTKGRPIRRTADDYDYDNDDRTEFTNPNDNMHSAWCMGINHDSYASAGCQVIVGYPRCRARGTSPDAGGWAVFKRNAYELSQVRFGYMLLDGLSAQALVRAGGQPVAAKLRYGSRGQLVPRVQQALKERGFYEGNIDEDFGERTIRAVQAFQTRAFGPGADDGIVGPMTASTLDLEWPTL